MPNTARIAVGGIAHETNTFSTLRTGLADFEVQRGEDAVAGPYWNEVRAQGVEVVGTLIAYAYPHGLVEAAAYQTLKAELVERLQRALPVDGVYLVLHGAMEVESIGDGESDLAQAIRATVGPDVPIAASLDLHGNLAPSLTRDLDALVALRTAPHRDGAETRARAVGILLRSIHEARRPVTAMSKPPILLAGEWAVTDAEPARSLYGLLPEISSRPDVLDASFMIGCAWTDSPYTSAAALVVGWSREAAAASASALARGMWNRRAEFGPEAEVAGVGEAVERALAAPESTVFISDSGDNVTAGGAGDSPTFVERLVAAGASSAVVAGVADPAAAEACRLAGVGAAVDVAIGGKLDATNFRPLPVRGRVEQLGEGFAVLRVGGVEVVLTADRKGFTTLADFARVGLDPLARKVVVVKLGYLFPELRAVAPRAIMALSPGFTDLQLDRLPFRRLTRPIYPLDGDFAWSPKPA